MKPIIVLFILLFVVAWSGEVPINAQTPVGPTTITHNQDESDSEFQVNKLSRLEFAKLSREEQLKIWNKISDEQKYAYWKEKIEVLKDQFQKDASKLKFITAIEDQISVPFFSREMSAESERFFKKLIDTAINEWGLEFDFVHHTVFSLDDYTPKK